MKKNFRIVPLSFVIAVLAFAGCNKSQNAPTVGKSAVMFVNVTETGSKVISLDGKLNNELVKGAPNGSGGLFTLGSSGYLSIPSGRQELAFCYADGTTVVSKQHTFAYNTFCSYFVFGPLSAPRNLLTYDELSRPDAGYAKVRFLNFCSSTQNLSSYFNNILIDSTVLYEGYYSIVSDSLDVGFYEIPAGTGVLTMKDMHKSNVAASIPDQTFADGHIYTVLFADSDPNGSSGFYLSVITNQ